MLGIVQALSVAIVWMLFKLDYFKEVSDTNLELRIASRGRTSVPLGTAVIFGRF